MIRLITFACLLAAWPGPAVAAPAYAAAAVDPGALPARIEVSVDPRVELLAVVECLAGYQQLGGGGLAYRREVLARFAPWRSHPAVTLFARMAREGFTRDAPPAVMLRLAEPPALELRAPFSVYLETCAGGRGRLFAFLDSLRDFAAESRFMEFHAAHAARFRALVEEARRVLQRTRVVGPLEDYFGVREHGYHLILAPLLPAGRLRGGGRAPTRDRGLLCHPRPLGSAPRTAALLGPRRARGPAVARVLPRLRRQPAGSLPPADRRRFGPLRAAARADAAQGYARWEVCADEHLVRAVGVRLVARMEGSHAAERALDLQLRLGFTYLPRLLAGLERYERERAFFPTLGDFCPDLAEALHRPGAPRIEKP